MNKLDDTLVDKIQWTVQEQLDEIYRQVRRLQYIDGTRVDPSHRDVEHLIDKCIHNWLRTGDVYD